MKIPSNLANFIQKQILCGVDIMPAYYANLNDFDRFQDGYRINSLSGESLIGDQDGAWREGWYVFARNAMDDPFFIDFSLGGDSPVFFAYHGTGSWEAIKIAEDIEKFEEILLTLKEQTRPFSLECIADLADIRNEFYAELAQICLEEPLGDEGRVYEYYSLFLTGFSDKTKTLVFLKKFFKDGDFSATKSRLEKLPLHLMSGIKEVIAPLEEMLKELKAEFKKEEICFSEFIKRVGQNPK